MSLNPISSPLTRAPLPNVGGGVSPRGVEGEHARPAAPAPAATYTPSSRAAAAAPTAARGATLPAEAPPGTDPELWSVLTTEERTFLARSATMGPLTYGRGAAPSAAAPPAARGARLDVRA
jgi:hypothetical protein